MPTGMQAPHRGEGQGGRQAGRPFPVIRQSARKSAYPLRTTRNRGRDSGIRRPGPCSRESFPVACRVGSSRKNSPVFSQCLASTFVRSPSEWSPGYRLPTEYRQCRDRVYKRKQGFQGRSICRYQEPEHVSILADELVGVDLCLPQHRVGIQCGLQRVYGAAQRLHWGERSAG